MKAGTATTIRRLHVRASPHDRPGEENYQSRFRATRRLLSSRPISRGWLKMRSALYIAAARQLALGATFTLCALSLTACGSDPEFHVGDCVTISHGLTDSDLDTASCEEARGTLDPQKRTYKVDSIIEGTVGECPTAQGFYPVTFTDKPDGVIYCLTQADGSALY